MNPNSEPIPDLQTRPTWLFAPGDEGERALRDSDEAVARLEALRSGGCDFLLVPSTAFAWLDEHPGLKGHLDRHCRLVVREEDACTIYGVGDRWAGVATVEPAPDGLPLPPPEMIGLVAGTMDPGSFYEVGVLGARCIRNALGTQGLEIDEFETILDFGCGCGRVVRQWKDLEGSAVHGSDYNPYMIEWCRDNLPFASFGVNGLEPGLDHPDGSFDFIYTLSTFTHLDETLQEPWIGELARLLKNGGTLLLTVHGENQIGHLPDPLRDRFASGELVVLHSEYSGSNTCAAYHPEQYIRETFTRDLELLEILPGAAEDLGGQTSVLLRRRG